MCAGCHGGNGMSTNPDWPSLAGQHAPYLVKQLHDYKADDTRHNAIMTSIVTGLNDKDIDEIAAFYASLPLPEETLSKKDQLRGEAIYRRGDISKHITACIACHGPNGSGNAQAGFPVLSGQQSVYLIQELEQFKGKKRRNDLNAIMRDISARMSHEDMEAVAYYLTELR